MKLNYCKAGIEKHGSLTLQLSIFNFSSLDRETKLNREISLVKLHLDCIAARENGTAILAFVLLFIGVFPVE